MSSLKISLLAAFVLLAAVVNAQEHYYEVYEAQPNVRVQRDAPDYIFIDDNNDFSQHLRYRRDDESARHRRQGGHGGGHGGGHEGVTGPVHTFVKTDEHAHFKWGVRHHVGHEYAGRR